MPRQVTSWGFAQRLVERAVRPKTAVLRAAQRPVRPGIAPPRHAGQEDFRPAQQRCEETAVPPRPVPTPPCTGRATAAPKVPMPCRSPHPVAGPTRASVPEDTHQPDAVLMKMAEPTESAARRGFSIAACHQGVRHAKGHHRQLACQHGARMARNAQAGRQTGREVRMGRGGHALVQWLRWRPLGCGRARWLCSVLNGEWQRLILAQCRCSLAMHGATAITDRQLPWLIGGLRAAQQHKAGRFCPWGAARWPLLPSRWSWQCLGGAGQAFKSTSTSRSGPGGLLLADSCHRGTGKPRSVHGSGRRFVRSLGGALFIKAHHVLHLRCAARVIEQWPQRQQQQPSQGKRRWQAAPGSSRWGHGRAMHAANCTHATGLPAPPAVRTANDGAEPRRQQPRWPLVWPVHRSAWRSDDPDGQGGDAEKQQGEPVNQRSHRPAQCGQCKKLPVAMAGRPAARPVCRCCADGGAHRYQRNHSGNHRWRCHWVLAICLRQRHSVRWPGPQASQTTAAAGPGWPLFTAGIPCPPVASACRSSYHAISATAATRIKVAATHLRWWAMSHWRCAIPASAAEPQHGRQGRGTPPGSSPASPAGAPEQGLRYGSPARQIEEHQRGAAQLHRR